MSPIISGIVGQVGAPVKERIASGTQDWTLSEDDPDIATVICAHCKRSLHFSPSITRVSIEAEMQNHRRTYCHGESV